MFGGGTCASVKVDIPYSRTTYMKMHAPAIPTEMANHYYEMAF